MSESVIEKDGVYVEAISDGDFTPVPYAKLLQVHEAACFARRELFLKRDTTVFVANAPSLESKNGDLCFGCYHVKSGDIYLAYGEPEGALLEVFEPGSSEWQESVLASLFHEMVHQQQDENGDFSTQNRYDEDIEHEADQRSQSLLSRYLEEIRKEPV